MEELQEERQAGELGTFIFGALVGAGLALLLTSEAGVQQRRRLGHWLQEHGAGGHDILVKLKKMLHIRQNGFAVNGRGSRRHKRS